MASQQTEAGTNAANLSEQRIQRYRRDGFVHIPGIISKHEAGRFREAALNHARQAAAHNTGIFSQFVNVWESDPTMRELTLHPNLAEVATKLAGVSLRLWHDHLLIKEPHNEKATEFHQDQPYWPHENSPDPLSAWVALCDVPVERGCMTFIPGSHERDDLAPQNLSDSRSLMELAPEMEWQERVTLPLKAGDCTFHHGRCAHMATPNATDDPRVAHVIIYMPRTTTYSGKNHPVTDRCHFEPGQVLEGEMFPDLGAP